MRSERLQGQAADKTHALLVSLINVLYREIDDNTIPGSRPFAREQRLKNALHKSIISLGGTKNASVCVRTCPHGLTALVHSVQVCRPGSVVDFGCRLSWVGLREGGKIGLSHPPPPLLLKGRGRRGHFGASTGQGFLASPWACLSHPRTFSPAMVESLGSLVSCVLPSAERPKQHLD